MLFIAYLFLVESLKQQKYDAILITSTYEKEITEYLKMKLEIDTEILSGNCLYKEWEKQYYNGKKKQKRG